MGCPCQNQNNVVQSVSAPVQQQNVISNDCGVTLQNILDAKANYLATKTPENAGWINSKIGLLDTMVNIGNYCIYSLY